MKKKLIVGLLLVVTLLFASGCGSASTVSVDDPNKIDITKMTSTEIVQKFVDAGFPIGKVSEYTAATDPNKMLGRPNAYIQKTDFADSRLQQVDPTYDPSGDVNGGMVEVFSNDTDANTRIAYVHSIVSSPGLFFQYEYSYKNVYFRVEGKLTPDQAAQYGEAFKALTNGQLPVPYVEVLS